ncbi:ImmA/IrrE family metallo-endopeptidase [Pediococcus acidilactici]|uniref:ImmA/IrrE family metallo-endopeptidase n=1 Tax=Pediococcus acidilactici TaxID=1254 RepID=UPI00232B9114|nr:ImmA/IrrE family metallo-endopeptidase [Pediococcus acidilactici]MDB8860141.1 ImmA/IrrE family metallo-endopeptidase [Pediococcus acidilactici]MDB8861138.1 ImmA/IrrE family metallo-endopeptidase [Pediococcus acidilactici]MDB8863338.1 ImmA/IrrE family metallo-endopeptidase [Pediococcus acidilactici]MDB8866029.1 ImmA/IrrE family metallo-endopeptidase [Pediococcus acidilactici]
MNNDKIKEAAQKIKQRYNTADPFAIAEKLNIDVEWTNLFLERPFAKTTYDKGQPLVLINARIKHLPSRNYTMAHELGHVILHEGLSTYYTGVRFGHSKLEHEADIFAAALLGLLYIEENDRYPDTLNELVNLYGMPKE